MVAIPIAYIVAPLLSHLVQFAPGLRSFPLVRPSAVPIIVGSAVGMGAVILSASFAALGRSRKQLLFAPAPPSTGTTGRFAPWIVGCETFAAVFVLALASVGVLGLRELSRRPSGFAAENVVTASLELVDNREASQQLNAELNRIHARHPRRD